MKDIMYKQKHINNTALLGFQIYTEKLQYKLNWKTEDGHTI